MRHLLRTLPLPSSRAAAWSTLIAGQIPGWAWFGAGIDTVVGLLLTTQIAASPSIVVAALAATMASFAAFLHERTRHGRHAAFVQGLLLLAAMLVVPVALSEGIRGPSASLIALWVAGSAASPLPRRLTVVAVSIIVLGLLATAVRSLNGGLL